MILHVLMFKDLRIGAFCTPQFVDMDPEIAATQLERSLIINIEDTQKIKPYNDLDMYWIADFDDQSGRITQMDPVFLLSCRDVIQSHIKAIVPDKEVKEEVKRA